jgi:hypothetical protein
LTFIRRLLTLRRSEVVPRLAGIEGNCAEAQAFEGGAFRVDWRLGDGSRLTLCANLGQERRPVRAFSQDARLLFEIPSGASGMMPGLPPHSAVLRLSP